MEGNRINQDKIQNDNEMKRKIIGEYLSELILFAINSGDTIEKIAMRIGVHKATVYRWANKEACPNIVEGIACILELGGSLMELDMRLNSANVQKAVIFDFLTNNPHIADLLNEIIEANQNPAEKIAVMLETIKKLNP